MVEHDWINMEVRFSGNATTKHGVELQRIRKKKKWAINEKKSLVYTLSYLPLMLQMEK